ncbi:MAG: CTP synthase, partial [Bacteroidota bacterium]
AEVAIVEIGGTVGDIESLPFLEAVRQMSLKLGRGSSAFVHLTLVPFIASAGELKTKPTQHSVKMLLEQGVQPDILVCRTEHPIGRELKRKVGLFCNVQPDAVIEAIDAPSIYEVPLHMMREGLDIISLRKLGLPHEGEANMEEWKNFIGRLRKPMHSVEIGLIGKYVELKDSYKSIQEALLHAGVHANTRVNLHWIKAETLADLAQVKQLSGLDGILVAPGFGERGWEGKINTIRFAREQKIPFLGICLGMQCAVIEFARHVLGLEGANSTEMHGNTPHPVIDLMPDQKELHEKGGTMRLGAYPCKIKSGTLADSVYVGEGLIRERHRHRYEFNNEYLPHFKGSAMVFSGMNPSRKLVEMVELQDHPWFLATQFHPEYRSTVAQPHPLFVGFVRAALAQQSAQTPD